MDSQTSKSLGWNSGIYKYLVSVTAWAMAAFHIYTGIFGIFESVLQRSAHVGFAMVLIFLLSTIRGKKERACPPGMTGLLSV